MPYRFRFLDEKNRIVDVAEHPNCADDGSAEQIALELLEKLNSLSEVRLTGGARYHDITAKFLISPGNSLCITTGISLLAIFCHPLHNWGSGGHMYVETVALCGRARL